MRLLFLANFVFLGACHVQASTELTKSKLTFSNTQKWFDYAEKVIRRPTFLVELDDNDLDKIHPPPENNSKIAQGEILKLINLQSKRSTADIRQIVDEFSFCSWNLGGFQFGLTNTQDDFIINILYDVSKIGFKLKKKFDRVRPSFLDSRILPGIDVPEHAAYPSNHSLESHALALVLGDLYPKLRDNFWNSADTISFHRELAGVHYSSDSDGGREIAKLVHKKLTTYPKYKDFIQKYQDLNMINFSKFVNKNRKQKCESLIATNVPK